LAAGVLRYELSTSTIGRMLFEDVVEITEATRLLVKTRKI